MPALTPTSEMPPGLQAAFALSLSRLASSGDPIQAAIAKASADYGARGIGTFTQQWWSLYADKGRLSLRLQYLYTVRELYTDLERRLFEWTTTAGDGMSQSDSDIFKAVAAMRADVVKDIDQLETQIRAGQTATMGVMTTTQPGPMPGPFCPNPNDPYYRGDPSKRFPGRW